MFEATWAPFFSPSLTVVTVSGPMAPRRYLMATRSPTLSASTAESRSSTHLTFSRPTPTMRSPSSRPRKPRRVALRPAAAAGPPGVASMMSAPCILAPPLKLLERLRTALSSAMTTPSDGLRTRPLLMIWPTTRRTVSTGMAKPMPLKPPVLDTSATLTPMRRPLLSSSGPPLLPGLMAASVCTQLRMMAPVTPRTSRPSALTTPLVKVRSRPKGLPMADAAWPTTSDELEPMGTGLALERASRPLPSMRSTAMSFSGSAPTRMAS
mmetsp:Transcript_27993/g.89207  ORF Transcript_27993/g.89207 Transcript_27993/m.89207 type:complete len:266 (-) Transcript_27993:4316-5113(-)